MSTLRIVAFSGSLRRASYNTAVLETLAERMADRMTVTIAPLHDVPVYNQDEDTETPDEAVARLRAAVGAADGLIVASPEYNHGMPGGLKNAFDWLSRPRGRAVLTGKPVLTITSSMAVTGGVRAHAQLNETLLSIAARLVVRPQAVIGTVHEKVADGRLVDPATLAFLSDAIDDLIKIIGVGSPVQIEQA